MDEECDCPPPGLPAYMGTFADLMSLLMCFFVLLLSFAEMDATKFKQIAESLEKAFGVQRVVQAIEPPMGTSIIFDKFSPGEPQPTVLDEIRQQTSQEDPKLKTQQNDATDKNDSPDKGQSPDDVLSEKIEKLIQQAKEQQVDKSAEQLAEVLQSQLASGQVQMEKGDEHILIRIEEKGSFGSGSADLTPELGGLLRDIGSSLSGMPGSVSIEGHTDNIPIRTARFRSNWDLSAARAASVATELLSEAIVDASRISVQGFADVRPLVPNDSAANRAKNRRIEIVVNLEQPLDAFEKKARDLAMRGQIEMIEYMGWQQPQ